LRWLHKNSDGTRHKMKIAIITDAWTPQVNGVVRTLQSVRSELIAMGHDILVISPNLYRSIPCPSYPEIRLALASANSVGARIAHFAPDAVHLSTEGPLCLAARRWCLRNGIAFTTAYHTQFPEYVAKRTRLPASLFWRYIRWFHRPAERILVSTESVRADLRTHGLTRLAHWGRGVDLDLFSPEAPHPTQFAELKRPVQLYVGRVSIEKNIEAFLNSNHPGSKIVVGDGPSLQKLKTLYPEAHFLGSLHGPSLAGAYAGADVFVFPSRTDTFGLVMIEALACGTPVAAFPVNGPIDIVTEATGALDTDITIAITTALTRNCDACVSYARNFGWQTSARQFLAALSYVEPNICAMPDKDAAHS
jgi:glycosyltransferase involved in cell wall biosynthesis